MRNIFCKKQTLFKKNSNSLLTYPERYEVEKRSKQRWGDDPFEHIRSVVDHSDFWLRPLRKIFTVVELFSYELQLDS